MGSVLGRILGVTLAVGSVIAIIQFFDWLNKQGEDYSLSSYDELLRNQKTVDEMNAREVVDWVKKVKAHHHEEMVFIVAYPTQENIRKYQLKGFPLSFDAQHNLLFLALKKYEYTPLEIQLISFGTMDKAFADEFFKGDDYAVVEE